MNKQTTRLEAEAWLDRHGDALYRYAWARTGARDQAEDVVQETLLAAWQARAEFRGDASERTWLLGILKHKLADHIRQRVRTQARYTEDDSDERIENQLFAANGTWRQPPGRWGGDPLAAAQYDAFLETLTRCLDDVPPAQRDSFVLRELGQVSAESAGQILGVTPNNLYVLLHRARLRLRRCLQVHWFSSAEQRK